ncbi:hypothetical protein ACH4C6_34180 [Streptomyces sp. NPDC017943]|uniref:hypothetical protein n=1 Tax=Streptomyces sp. NPDC017943 TaxID=3365019 RepID=UPI0037AE13FF
MVSAPAEVAVVEEDLAARGALHLRTPRPPLLRHRLNWERAGMAAALGYDTTSVIEVLEQIRAFYAGEPLVLVWDGLSARSRGMRA